MPTFAFPADRCAGVLSWHDPTNLSHHVRHDAIGNFDETDQLDLGFVAAFPKGMVTSVSLRGPIDVPSMASLANLAENVTQLSAPMGSLPDAALPHIVRLVHVTSLQTFGNTFTDGGVQVLGGMTALTHLYLEEMSLSAKAFDFVTELPNLEVLGVQDVRLSNRERKALERRLGDVSVHG